jgi:hypothetical protein
MTVLWYNGDLFSIFQYCEKRFLNNSINNNNFRKHRTDLFLTDFLEDKTYSVFGVKCAKAIFIRNANYLSEFMEEVYFLFWCKFHYPITLVLLLGSVQSVLLPFMLSKSCKIACDWIAFDEKTSYGPLAKNVILFWKYIYLILFLFLPHVVVHLVLLPTQSRSSEISRTKSVSSIII